MYSAMQLVLAGSPGYSTGAMLQRDESGGVRPRERLCVTAACPARPKEARFCARRGGPEEGFAFWDAGEAASLTSGFDGVSAGPPARLC